MEKGKKVLILGAGNFGTCLAQHLAKTGVNVDLWTRSKEVCRSINESHRNPKYLSHINLLNRIRGCHDFKQMNFSEYYTIIIAIPTQSFRAVLNDISSFIEESCPIVCAAKGIENETLKFPLEIIQDTLGDNHYRNSVILSGPSFAIDIMEEQPTAVSVAGFDPAIVGKIQDLFHTSFFRTYTSEDPLGLEIAGALKNIIAIAAGACTGLGFRDNARAALLTRGMAEITRIGVNLGANPVTFNGLGGIGDLFLTCTSEKSRNFRTGLMLSQGMKLDEIISQLGSVAEGIQTTKAAYQLVSKIKVDAPMIKQVYGVLYQDLPVMDAVNNLLNRDKKAEIT